MIGKKLLAQTIKTLICGREMCFQMENIVSEKRIMFPNGEWCFQKENHVSK